MCCTSYGFFEKRLYLFLERGEGREGERERNITVWLSLMCPPLGTWPSTQACALTGNQTSDPLVHRLALNPLTHMSQGHPMDFDICLTYIHHYDIIQSSFCCPKKSHVPPIHPFLLLLGPPETYL